MFSADDDSGVPQESLILMVEALKSQLEEQTKLCKEQVRLHNSCQLPEYTYLLLSDMSLIERLFGSQTSLYSYIEGLNLVCICNIVAAFLLSNIQGLHMDGHVIMQLASTLSCNMLSISRPTHNYPNTFGLQAIQITEYLDM